MGPSGLEQRHRMTQQRQIILEEVQRVDCHPTADEIYDRVRERLPKISLGTVYRNLDILSKDGIIKKIDFGYPQMRFDGNIREHYHVTCMACGKIEDIPAEGQDPTLHRLERTLLNVTKYKIFGHNLEFVGLCPGCMDQMSPSLDEKMREIEGKADG